MITSLKYLSCTIWYKTSVKATRICFLVVFICRIWKKNTLTSNKSISNKICMNGIMCTKTIICFQEQYKTIYLTLYEMFKEPTSGHSTGNTIQNLQTIKKTIRPTHRKLKGSSRSVIFISTTQQLLFFKKSIVGHYPLV